MSTIPARCGRARGRPRHASTDDPAQADVLLSIPARFAKKAQEKVFSLLGEWRLFKQQVRTWLSASAAASQPGGRGHHGRAPFVDLVFAPKPCTACRTMLPGTEGIPADRRSHQFSGIEKSTGCLRPARRAPPHSYRSWKGAASIAAFASCPIRAAKEISRPFEQVLQEVQR